MHELIRVRMSVVGIDLSGAQLALARLRVPRARLAQSDLLCLGARDLPEDDDAESWLGTHMFWSHFDADTNLEMLRAEHFDVLRDEFVTDPMGHGHHLFALVAAH